MGQFVATIIMTILGFVIGGVVGINFTDAAAFAPACWWGALAGFLVSLGGCLCFLDDVF